MNLTKEKVDEFVYWLKTFDVMLSDLDKLSFPKTAVISEEMEKRVAYAMIGVICVRCITLRNLFRNVEKYIDDKECVVWDYFSMCVLVRSIVDSYLIMYHYCVEETPTESEREFKRLFWLYYALYKGIKGDKSKFPEIDLELKDLWGQIEVNEYFINSVNGGRKDRFKKCKEFHVPTNKEIANKAGLNENLYTEMYNYLSNSVHGDSLLTVRASNYEAGSDNSLVLINKSVKYCMIFIALCIRDICKFSPELCGSVSMETKRKMEEILANIQAERV